MQNVVIPKNQSTKKYDINIIAKFIAETLGLYLNETTLLMTTKDGGTTGLQFKSSGNSMQLVMVSEREDVYATFSLSGSLNSTTPLYLCYEKTPKAIVFGTTDNSSRLYASTAIATTIDLRNNQEIETYCKADTCVTSDGVKGWYVNSDLHTSGTTAVVSMSPFVFATPTQGANGYENEYYIGKNIYWASVGVGGVESVIFVMNGKRYIRLMSDSSYATKTACIIGMD